MNLLSTLILEGDRDKRARKALCEVVEDGLPVFESFYPDYQYTDYPRECLGAAKQYLELTLSDLSDMADRLSRLTPASDPRAEQANRARIGIVYLLDLINQLESGKANAATKTAVSIVQDIAATGFGIEYVKDKLHKELL